MDYARTWLFERSNLQTFGHQTRILNALCGHIDPVAAANDVGIAIHSPRRSGKTLALALTCIIRARAGGNDSTSQLVLTNNHRAANAFIELVHHMLHALGADVVILEYNREHIAFRITNGNAAVTHRHVVHAHSVRDWPDQRRDYAADVIYFEETLPSEISPIVLNTIFLPLLAVQSAKVACVRTPRAEDPVFDGMPLRLVDTNPEN